MISSMSAVQVNKSINLLLSGEGQKYSLHIDQNGWTIVADIHSCMMTLVFLPLTRSSNANRTLSSVACAANTLVDGETPLIGDELSKLVLEQRASSFLMSCQDITE